MRALGLFVPCLALVGCASLLGIEQDYELDPAYAAGGGGTASGGRATGGNGSGGVANGGLGGGGSGGDGSSGIGGVPSSSVPFVAICAGNEHGCGRRSDGSLRCWGGFYAEALATVPVGAFGLLRCGVEASCALDPDGYPRCWGASSATAAPNLKLADLDVGSETACGVVFATGAVECWGSGSPLTNELGPFDAVRVGDRQVCARKADHTLRCWGGAYEPTTDAFSQFDVGHYHGCGLRESDSTVVCFGSNFYGESTPPPGVFSAVTVGDNFSCGTRGSGAVECWGTDFTGVVPPPPRTLSALSAGSGLVCGLEGTHAVCWGSSFHGGTVPPTE